MKNLFLISLHLIFALPAFCQLNYSVNINDVAQIKFPGSASVRNKPGTMSIYTYQGQQQSYVVQATHDKTPTVGHSASDIRDNYFNSQIKLEVGALKGTLLYKKNIQIDGVNGIEYSYTYVTQNVKIYNYNRYAFFNEVGIDYYIMSREPLKPNNKILNDYFNSFKITVSPKSIKSLK